MYCLLNKVVLFGKFYTLDSAKMVGIGSFKRNVMDYTCRGNKNIPKVDQLAGFF